MSKKLKRRIREACGIEFLGSKEEKRQRASEILNDAVEKQAICNQVLGASHKDIEKALKDVLAEKRSKQQITYEELEDEAPQKLDPEVENKRRYTPEATRMVEMLDPKEINGLINESGASKAIQEVYPERAPDSYGSYSFEEVAALLDNSYNPNDFKYL